VQPGILDIFFRKLYVQYIDWGHISLCVVNMTVFELRLDWFAVSVKQCLDHCPWLILQQRRRMLRLYILLWLAGLQCIAGITVATRHCPGMHRHWLGRFCVLSFNFHEKMFTMQIGFRRRNTLNLYRSPVCHTLSNSKNIARNAAEDYCLYSMASFILCKFDAFLYCGVSLRIRTDDFI
jgi:hypothetical protein